MKKFPIMLVEQFCEIKAHTIRMWEVRHSFLKPKRTDTNLRSYDLSELKDLLNISLLNRNGYKISSLARRSGAEIEQLIQQQNNDIIKKQRAVNNLLISMLEADVDRFSMQLNDFVDNWGICSVIKEVIFPFIQKAFYNKTQFVWWEQLITEELKAKIIRGIEECGYISDFEKSALVFLPQKHYWDLPLLLISFIAKEQGIRVSYLGGNTSIENIEAAIEARRPDFVITGFMTRQQDIAEITDYINRYSPDARLIITGTDKASKYQTTGKEKFVLNKDLFSIFTKENQPEEQFQYQR